MTTTEPTPEAVEELARVNAQHRYVDVRGDYEVGDGRRYFGCTCGWTHDVDGMSGYWSWVEEHERHAARAVLAAGYVSPEEHRALVERFSRMVTRNADNQIRRDEARGQVARVKSLADEFDKVIPSALSDGELRTVGKYAVPGVLSQHVTVHVLAKVAADLRTALESGS